MPSTLLTSRSPHRRLALAGALLIVVTTVAPAAAATPVVSGATATECTAPSSPTSVVDGDAASTAPPVPNETRDLDVALGDVAVVPLSVPVNANVTVTVGDDDGYAAAFHVEDDGDGGVTLLVNTYLAANGSTVETGTFRAQGDDAATAVDRDAGAPMTPDTHPVVVRWNGRTVAERDLTVTEPVVNGVDVVRSGPGLFDAADASAIRRANRSGRLRALAPGEYAPVAVRGETLLVRVDAPSLLGALAAQPGETTTERFLGLYEGVGPDSPERFELSGPCGGVLLPSTVAVGGARVLADYRAGAFYVLLDTDGLVGIPQGTVRLELSRESRLAPRERDFVAEFQVGNREVTVRGGEPVALDDGASAEIAGETNFPPGTRLPVVVESLTDSGLERRAVATVREDGSFVATVDLSNVSAPELFAVTIAGERFPGETGRPPAVFWDLDNRRDADAIERLWLDRLRLPDGGFLVAYEYDRKVGRFRETGVASAGADDLSVDPVEEGRYLLVVAHRDGDGDGSFDGPATDPPYRVDGRAVSEWVGLTANGTAPPPAPPSVSVERAVASTPTPTPTAPPTPTPAPTTAAPSPATPTDTDATTARRTPTPSTPTTPGFGPLLALLAVLAAALLVGRR